MTTPALAASSCPAGGASQAAQAAQAVAVAVDADATACPASSHPAVQLLRLPELGVSCVGADPSSGCCNALTAGFPAVLRARIRSWEVVWRGGMRVDEPEPVERLLCPRCVVIAHERGRLESWDADQLVTIPTIGELDVAEQYLQWLRDPGTRGEHLDDAQRAVGEVTGLPRPVVRVERRKTDGTVKSESFPAPWINGAFGALGDFFTFRPDMLRSLSESLCCICGDGLAGEVAIAAAHGRKETSAGWGHPLCVLIAVRRCPHFSEAKVPFDTVAWRWNGPGVGVARADFSDTDAIEDGAEPLSLDALKAWAKQSPYGT